MSEGEGHAQAEEPIPPRNDYDEWLSWALGEFGNDTSRARRAARAATEARSVGAPEEAAERAARSAAGAPPPEWVSVATAPSTSIMPAPAPETPVSASLLDDWQQTEHVEAADANPALAPVATGTSTARRRRASAGHVVDPATASESYPAPPATKGGSRTLGEELASWVTDGSIRNRWLIGGSLAFAVTAVAALAMTLLLLLAVVSFASSVASGLGVTSSSATPSSGSADLRPLGVVFGFFFFQSHLAPYSVTLSSLGTSVFGVGSLTVLLLGVGFSFRAGRHVERSRTVPEMPSVRVALRGSLVALPYWVGSLAIFAFAGVQAGSGALSFSLEPFGVAVVTPLLIAGIAGALGALSVHPRPSQAPRQHPVRDGLVWAATAIVVGEVLVVLLLILIPLLNGALHPAAAPSVSTAGGTSTGDLASQAGQQIGNQIGKSIVDAVGPILMFLLFYLLNAVVLAWGSVVSGQAESGGGTQYLLLLAPALALLFASMNLRVRDTLQRVTFTLGFGLGTGVLAYIVSPSIGAHNAGPPPVQLFALATVAGASAALVGPYLAAVPVLSAARGAAPVQWTARRFQRLWPAVDVAAASGAVAPPAGVELEPFRLTRRAAIVMVVVVVVVAGIAGGYVALAANYSPDKTALAFAQAQADGDIETMWDTATFESQTGGPLFTRSAVAAMMQVPANRDLSRIKVSGVQNVDDNTAKVTLSISRNGAPTSWVVQVRKDSGKHQMLIFPSWRVDIPAANLSITTADGLGQLAVDGIPVTPPAFGTVEVISGFHKVTTAGSDVVASDSDVVDATGGTASVSFQPSFAAGVEDKARAALTADFNKRCVGRLPDQPLGCPNEWFAIGSTNTDWTLNNFTIDKFSLGSSSDEITASGSYAMHYSYDEDFGFGSLYHSDQPVSGTFTADMKWNGSSFDVMSYSRF